MDATASHIFKISLEIIYYFNIILFGISLIFCFRKYTPGYMKTFPIYCFGNLLVEILARSYPQITIPVYNFFTLFELLYFSFLLTSIVGSRATRKIVWAFNTVFSFFFLK